MRNINTIALLLLPILLSCINEEQPRYELDIDIYLVNEKGEVVNTFEVGEVPIVVMEVNNIGEERRFDPAFHYGDHLHLYSKTESNTKVGSFYKNGQVTNEYRLTHFSANTKTMIRFPWQWKNGLATETVEMNLEREKVNRFFPSNTYADPANSELGKGSYLVKLMLPTEWGLMEESKEIEFSIL